MKYEIFRTRQFKKDYKNLSDDNKNLIKDIILQLALDIPLDEKYLDHKLIGDYMCCRECHVKSDLLLIYKINSELSELALVRVGKHSDLFQ